MNTPFRAETGQRHAVAPRPQRGPQAASGGGTSDGVAFFALWLIAFVGVVMLLYMVVLLSPRDARDQHDPVPPGTDRTIDRGLPSPGPSR